MIRDRYKWGRQSRKLPAGKMRVSTMDFHKKVDVAKRGPDTSCYMDLTMALKGDAGNRVDRKVTAIYENRNAGPRKETESEGGLGMVGNKLQI